MTTTPPDPPTPRTPASAAAGVLSRTGILVDTNLLVYAILKRTPQHEAARAWLTAQLAEPDGLVGLPWSALFGFTRLVTSPRVAGDGATTLTRAWDVVTTLLAEPTARVVDPGPTHAALTADLLATPGLSSTDVPDVHLAALAIEHGLTLCSHDHGFARFARLHWTDPLTP